MVPIKGSFATLNAAEKATIIKFSYDCSSDPGFDPLISLRSNGLGDNQQPHHKG